MDLPLAASRGLWQLLVPSGVYLHVECRGVLVTYLQGGCAPDHFLGKQLTALLECDRDYTRQRKRYLEEMKSGVASVFNFLIQGTHVTH